ncbi:uncharacterized protein BJX67DRAFT_355893 [Aspergillus lucknowensis]|uniref:Mid2 domain-containing protein n=1 Tax=Aspergillus lucknowensis TaxID=176173 RepID=A0ABR4LPK1_9EURO
MKSFIPLLALGASLSRAAETNFFISPGSQADQLASGNHTADYPVYQQHETTLFSWNTNWTLISLLLYQNENASFIRLIDFEEDAPNTYRYDMNPPVDLSWNDVFFLTLWNENWQKEGGERFFSSSYFRINASDSDSDPSTTTTTTTSTSTSTSTTSSPTTSPTDKSASSEPQTTDPSSSNADNEGGGLSSKAKVGLGVGIGLGVPALALAGVAAFYFRRRAQAQQYQRAQQFPPPGGGAGQYAAGAGYPSPAVSDINNPSPFKLGGSSTIPGYAGPVEVDSGAPGGAHQSRFQELPNGQYAR